MIEELFKRVRDYLPDEDLSPLKKAFEYSREAHKSQVRASGDDFFSHCFAVALILTELKLDIATLMAGLLHDVLEDTKITSETLKAEFGPEVTTLVEGVTKISSYHFQDPQTAQSENWRKLLLAVTKDIRVILIKLADRIHNLRTIKYLEPDKQKRIAYESLNLYAPFAQRLGIYKWKNELEDLSFAVLEPVIYDGIRLELEKKQEKNIQSIEYWKNLLLQKLSPYGIGFRLLARPKNVYGIYKKMQRQKKSFDEIQDYIGLRLVTASLSDCYALLGFIHTQFKAVPGSFTDYITLPKTNMYQSLHITVYGDGSSMAEIQIRTEEMHRRSEYGIAAHWRYKENGKGIHPESMMEIENKLDWLKQVLEWQNELTDPKEFLNAIKAECAFEQIFVFTPKGRVIKLPAGATTVDFAFAVHTEIGNHCYGAKVENKMTPLSYKLKSGEICEILTRKNSEPNEDWLEFVLTARARSKIRKYLREKPKK